MLNVLISTSDEVRTDIIRLNAKMASAVLIMCSHYQRGNNAPRARDGRVQRGGQARCPAAHRQLDRLWRAILAADATAQVGVHRGASLRGAAGQEAAQGMGTNLP